MLKERVKIWAIVPAAGIGQRMQSDLPKQYLPLNGKPILAWTLDAICRVPEIFQVIVPLHPEDIYWQQQIHLTYPHLQTVTGGKLRFESVQNALDFIKPKADANDWVLVHDAVRPCITPREISELLANIVMHPVGGLWGVPVRDTLKKVDETQQVIKTVSRDDLWHALTPQIFRFGMLQEALFTAKRDNIMITDEAGAIEHLGYHPQMVRGSYANIKITYPEDLRSASLWISQMEQAVCE
jgi:2-C-methyl-D-erythritol 4-phosphate cytidylyltransferase